MNKEWQTEILQKLSSTAVPPKGHTVLNMNKILDCEMKGLILDEEKLMISSGFVCLTHCIFPHALDSLTPEHLNNSYHKLKLTSANTTEVPRENSTHRLACKKAIAPKPASCAQSRSAKKKSDLTLDILYDAKHKLWQWVDVVPRRVNKDINKFMEEYFTLANDLEGVLAGIHQETVQATCMDTESSGMSNEEPSFLCKGAAYDGDSSRDQDYFWGNRKQKDKPLVENQFSAFLNMLPATVLQHLNERDCTARANVRAVAAHHWWHGDFSVKKLDSVDDKPHWFQKLDLILLEGSQDGGDPITWKSPSAISEFTHSKLAVNMTLIKTLNTKAYILLSSQPWCHYVLSLSFANFQMRIHFYDRSGAQISSPLNFHCNFQVVADIIHMFAHADQALLGYDLMVNIYPAPSIPKQVRPLFNFIGTIQGPDSKIYSVFELLWSSSSFIGHDTICYHVCPEVAGPSKAN